MDRRGGHEDKLVSIPEWLDDEATVAGIHFSAVLQEALRQQLHIQ